MLRRLEGLTPPELVTTESAAEHLAVVDEIAGRVERETWSNAALADLCGIAALHRDPWVRHRVLRALGAQAPLAPDVEALVLWATHDPDDFVAFEAIALARQHRLRSALRDLFAIVGRASRRVAGGEGKPVGIGHALVIDAISEIAGSSDPAVLARLEEDLFDSLEPPRIEDFDPPRPGPHRRVPRPAEAHADMVLVPAGTVKLALPDGWSDERLAFDWSDVREPAELPVDAFWIDRFQVTAAQYDRFAASDAARSHAFCHPSEPPDKLHTRNTVVDPRFGPEHPATGVDWFDAYAYAAWAGKRLPTEAEWQRAAQGDDGRPFPWGRDYDHACARSVTAHGFDGADLGDWRAHLVGLWRDTAFAPTVEVEASGPASPFGAVGMSGNAWEWTGSSFFWRDGLSPDVGDRDVVDLIYDLRAYPVIRGGTWSSLPEMTSAAFRGSDLLTDRHYENGFRCVCDAVPDDAEGR